MLTTHFLRILRLDSQLMRTTSASIEDNRPMHVYRLLKPGNANRRCSTDPELILVTCAFRGTDPGSAFKVSERFASVAVSDQLNLFPLCYKSRMRAILSCLLLLLFCSPKLIL